jgi:hypothetical protein
MEPKIVEIKSLCIGTNEDEAFRDACYGICLGLSLSVERIPR